MCWGDGVGGGDGGGKVVVVMMFGGTPFLRIHLLDTFLLTNKFVDYFTGQYTFVELNPHFTYKSRLGKMDVMNRIRNRN